MTDQIPRRITRRGFLKAIGITTVTLGVSCLAGYGYIFYIEPQWPSIESIEIPVSNLPRGLCGFKIVCLSDFHLHPFTQIDLIEQIVLKVNELEPDLICLLGDYVFERADSIDELAPVLSRLKSGLGTFAVLGNHDLWTDAGVVRDGLERVGIRVLINERVVFQLGGDALALVGLDDGWSGAPDLSKALEDTPVDTAVILMIHEPDFADLYAQDDRILLQLSGHTHGGQVRLPGVGAPFLPAFGRKYDQGLYKIDEMWLYTTRGVGVIDPPARFNCRPEITEILLRSA